MPLDDTSPEARETYLRRMAAMTPAERVRLGIALWEAGDSIQRAGMRRKHPHADEDEITFQVAASRYGLELARKAYRRS